MGSLSISRVHQAFTHEFAWSQEGTEPQTTQSTNVLTRCVLDSSNQNLYIGQSHGHICQLNLLELGTHSPRLFGKHDGLVRDICIYPFMGSRSVNLVASCSADSSIKIWAHDPKLLHSTKPCLQTLYGHTAAVTCLAAVHQYLVSGAADGSVLLWRTADTGLLALPHFQAAVSNATSTNTYLNGGWFRTRRSMVASLHAVTLFRSLVFSPSPTAACFAPVAPRLTHDSSKVMHQSSSSLQNTSNCLSHAGQAVVI